MLTGTNISQIQSETTTRHNLKVSNQPYKTEQNTIDRMQAENITDGSFTFGDLIDVINPLQHLPLIGSAYRAITGDEISDTARVAGGILYGGIAGGALSVANVVAKNETGEDLGTQILNTAFPNLKTSEETQLADTATSLKEAKYQNDALISAQNASLDGVQQPSFTIPGLTLPTSSLPHLSIGLPSSDLADEDKETSSSQSTNTSEEPLQNAPDNLIEILSRKTNTGPPPPVDTVENNPFEAPENIHQFMNAALDKYQAADLGSSE